MISNHELANPAEQGSVEFIEIFNLKANLN